ncbi:Integrator complex subunit 4 [Balamuthia mandrillaris]
MERGQVLPPTASRRGPSATNRPYASSSQTIVLGEPTPVQAAPAQTMTFPAARRPLEVTPAEPERRDLRVIPLRIRQLMESEFEELGDSSVRTRRMATLALLQGIPLPEGQQTSHLVEVLQQRLRAEVDVDIKNMVVTLLSKLACQPFVNALPVWDELLDQLISERSTSVKVQLLKALLALAQVKGLPSQALISVAQLNLCHSSHLIRRQCLLVLAHLTSAKELPSSSSLPLFIPSSSGAQPTLPLLSQFLSDADPRVRTAALQGVLILQTRGFTLDVVHLYSSAVAALNDDYESVRLEAVKLLWVLSNMYPDTNISSGMTVQQKKMRLVDDGFMKICNTVNDASPTVRQLACSLLGSIREVKVGYLLQTLTKDVLVQGKGSQSDPYQQQQQRSRARSSASSRNRYTNPAGDMDISAFFEDSVMLTSDIAAAAGAFVHGLEDEYYEVRSAAVDSLCELSMRSQHLATRAVEYLVDMFNDEIDEVCINSIESVHKIGAKVQIKEEQLHTILAVLEEASAKIREAVHHLLATIKVSNITCLLATVQALLANFQRYPDDQLSILHCLKSLGKHHGNFAEFLVEDILHLYRGMDMRFLAVEPHTNDVPYIAIMVFLFNAALSSPNILRLLPSFTMRHHRFLKDKFPDLIPNFQTVPTTAFVFHNPSPASSASTSTVSASSPTSSFSSLASLSAINNPETSPPSFFRSTVNQSQHILSLIATQNLPQAKNMISTCARNLKHLASTDPTLCDEAEFYLLYLQCLTILVQTKRDPLRGTTTDSAHKLLRLTYQLQHLFLGVHSSLQFHIYQLRLYAYLLFLSAFYVSNTPTIEQEMNHSGEDAKYQASFQKLLKTSYNSHSPVGISTSHIQTTTHLLNCITNTLTSYSQHHNIPLSHQLEVFNQRVQDLVSSFAATDGHRQVLDLLTMFLPAMVASAQAAQPPGQQLKRSSAEITQPRTNPDKAEEFLSSLPLQLRVEATVRNVRDVSRLMVQVTFPDLTSQLFSLNKQSFKPLRPNCYRMAETLAISIPQREWSGQASLQIQIVQAFHEGVPSPLTAASWQDPKAPPSSNSSVPPSVSESAAGVVTLCPPHLYHILPKPRTLPL